MPLLSSHDAATSLQGFMLAAEGSEIVLAVYGSGGEDSRLVTWHDDGVMQAVLMGRLYYRDEVAARLGKTMVELAGENDAALALRVYRQAGQDGLERLEGDFGIAVVDRKARRIVALRDPYGGYPIYWSQQGDTIALGTSVHALTARLPERKLDIGTLAEFITMPFGEFDYYGGTMFEGVHRLVSGARLVADLSAGTVRQETYWNWQDHVVDPGTDKVPEIAERYGDALRRAVRERSAGSVAAHLSGGMDSTAAALLARDELAARGQPLHALSLVYERLESLTEERPYLEAALRGDGLVAHRIVADDILDYDSFSDRCLYDEPYSGFFRKRGDIVMTDTAAAAGCDTILTGNGADEVLDAAPYYLADLVRAGHVRQAWSEASIWAKAHHKSPWSLLGPFGLEPLLPAWASAGIGPLLRGGRAAWKEQNEVTIPPWLLPDFVAHGNLLERFRERRRSNFPAASSIVLSETLGRIRHTSGDWGRYHLGAPRGVHIAHPFRDPRVMGIGLGARMRVRPRPDQQKAVLAEAMKDVLPEEILRRRNKAHFNAVYFGGIARNQPMLEDMVHASDAGRLGLFDKDILIKCLQDVSLGYRNLRGTAGLDNSLNLIHWLSHLPRWSKETPRPRLVMRIALDGA